jgi:hypothetical protein
MAEAPFLRFICYLSVTDQKTGQSSLAIKKRIRASPMVAKRIIVAAFAAFVLIGAPFAFPSQSDLFVDTPAGYVTTVAAN